MRISQDKWWIWISLLRKNRGIWENGINLFLLVIRAITPLKHNLTQRFAHSMPMLRIVYLRVPIYAMFSRCRCNHLPQSLSHALPQICIKAFRIERSHRNWTHLKQSELGSRAKTRSQLVQNIRMISAPQSQARFCWICDRKKRRHHLFCDYLIQGRISRSLNFE